jgi:hypothetical protein
MPGTVATASAMTPAATAISRKRNRTLALISERNTSGRLFCRAVQEKAGR